jgi:hypothetical protein
MPSWRNGCDRLANRTAAVVDRRPDDNTNVAQASTERATRSPMWKIT